MERARLSRMAAMAFDRDDDRSWKAGFLYVNRNDPALMVAKRFGVGWTVNLGNPAGWLPIAAVVGTPAALSAILAALHA